MQIKRSLNRPQKRKETEIAPKDIICMAWP